MSDYWKVNNSNRERAARLVAAIKNQCVIVSGDRMSEILGNNPEQCIKTWCTETFGEPRQCHPLYEAEEGWIDYFEGDWASDTVDEGYSYWFARKQDQALFKLTWL